MVVEAWQKPCRALSLIVHIVVIWGNLKSSTVSDKQKLISELESGFFSRITFLKNSKYFISKTGRVLSLNSGEPKELSVRINAARISTIVLYTPKLKSFEVARLMLRTFTGEPQNNKLVPEYIDGNPENVDIKNIRWGSSDNTINNETLRSIEVASTLVNSRSDLEKSETHLVNMALKHELLNGLLQIVRVTIVNTLEASDGYALNVLIDEIARIVNSNVIVSDAFHQAIPTSLKNPDLTKIVMELKNEVETNISLYRGAIN